MRILAAGWNVAGLEPPTADYLAESAPASARGLADAISAWLDPSFDARGRGAPAETADLVAIGLAEAIDLSPYNVLRESATPDAPSDEPRGGCGSGARSSRARSRARPSARARGAAGAGAAGAAAAPARYRIVAAESLVGVALFVLARARRPTSPRASRSRPSRSTTRRPPRSRSAPAAGSATRARSACGCA